MKCVSIREQAFGMLVGFLPDRLPFDSYSETFAEDLADILRDNIGAEQAKSVHTNVQNYVRNEKGAVETVDEVLTSLGLDTDTLLNDARDRRAKELAQDYFRGDPDVTTLVNDLLTAAGTSIDGFMAKATEEKLEYIERADRMTAIAASRRDASLREIDRRRADLGETLRRTVQQIEDKELEVVKSASGKREKAA